MLLFLYGRPLAPTPPANQQPDNLDCFTHNQLSPCSSAALRLRYAPLASSSTPSPTPHPPPHPHLHTYLQHHALQAVVLPGVGQQHTAAHHVVLEAAGGRALVEWRLKHMGKAPADAEVHVMTACIHAYRYACNYSYVMHMPVCKQPPMAP